MNVFTFIALLIIIWCCIMLALKYIEHTAISDARSAGKVKRREHRLMMDRLNKMNNYNVKGDW